MAGDSEGRVFVDGQEADADGRALLERDAWGHFTAMQVRDGRTRGLDLHLARLDAAHRDIYGERLDPDLVRARIRGALGDVRDASVRVYGYWAGLIVVVREPGGLPARPHSMRSQHFQRPLARLKHVGSWAGGHFRDRAIADGYDEGLLVDHTGRISEGTITNVGFWRDGTLVWPDAPMLDGITMLVLRRELRVPQVEAVVRVADLPSYDGMFLCNARGWAPVNRVDDLDLPVDATLVALLADAYDNAPRDAI
jgi:branched-subunit amino acid aminotransferase/4-amino-4-deoxychorismate lyase